MSQVHACSKEDFTSTLCYESADFGLRSLFHFVFLTLLGSWRLHQLWGEAAKVSPIILGYGDWFKDESNPKMVQCPKYMLTRKLKRDLVFLLVDERQEEKCTKSCYQACLIIFLLKIYFVTIFYLKSFVSVYEPMADSRGYWIPWSLSFRGLWAFKHGC